jgi:hypothetical protein
MKINLDHLDTTILIEDCICNTQLWRTSVYSSVYTLLHVQPKHPNSLSKNKQYFIHKIIGIIII